MEQIFELSQIDVSPENKDKKGMVFRHHHQSDA